LVVRLVFVLAAIGTLAVPRAASALGNVEGEIAVKAGIAAPGDVGIESPLGPGGGARAGVSIHGFYAGVEAVNYWGNAEGLIGLQGGFETGYGFRPGDGIITLRPQLGVGAILFTGSEEDGVPDSRIGPGGGPYFQPALTILVGLGTHYFVGADLGALIVPGALYDETTYQHTTLVALTAHVQLGIKF
jgi:hypothetical protein